MKETDLLEQFTVGAKLENWDTELLAGKESWVSWTDNNRKAIDVTHEYTVSHTHTHTNTQNEVLLTSVKPSLSLRLGTTSFLPPSHVCM